jgi:hypothetical protein
VKPQATLFDPPSQFYGQTLNGLKVRPGQSGRWNNPRMICSVHDKPQQLEMARGVFEKLPWLN